MISDASQIAAIENAIAVVNGNRKLTKHERIIVTIRQMKIDAAARSAAKRAGDGKDAQ